MPPATAPDNNTEEQAEVELPIISCAIDEIAFDALMRHQPDHEWCSWCGEVIVGEPAATGLFMWTRGRDDVRFDEPPLCGSCSHDLNANALHRWRCDS